MGFDLPNLIPQKFTPFSPSCYISLTSSIHFQFDELRDLPQSDDFDTLSFEL